MNFESSLKQAVKILNQAKAKKLLEDFIVIGAIALSRVAIVRSTGDIDFAIKLKDKSLKELGAFLKGEAREGDIYDPLLGCISFKTGKGSMAVNIQTIQFPKAIEDAAFIEPVMKTISGSKVPFASWKGLLFLKLYAGSSLDMADAENIIKHNKYSAKELEEIKTRATRLRLSKRLDKVLKVQYR